MIKEILHEKSLGPLCAIPDIEKHPCILKLCVP